MTQDLKFKHTCPICGTIEECESRAFVAEKKEATLRMYHCCSACGHEWTEKQKTGKVQIFK